MTDELLPALPEPVSDFKLYPVFTEDQMHAYAREAIRQALAALPGGGVGSLKRYAPVFDNNDPKKELLFLAESPDGEWVKFADVRGANE